MVWTAHAVAIYSNALRQPANEAHNANVRILISAMQQAMGELGRGAFVVAEGNNSVWHKDSPDEGNDENGSLNPC
jgi:hypothetical protein